MAKLVEPVQTTSILLEASETLACCRSRAELVECMQSALDRLLGGIEFDIVHFDAGSLHSLRVVPASVPAPTAAARAELERAREVVEDGTSFVPLIARGELHGWIAARVVAPLDPMVRVLASQYAAALVILNAAPPAPVPTLGLLSGATGLGLTNTDLDPDLRYTDDRLTALNALSLALSTADLPANDIINMAIAGAIGTTNAEGGGAAVVFAQGLPGRPVTAYGTGESARIDHELLSAAVPTGRDYAELVGPAVPPAAAAAGVRLLLVMPLRGARLPVGVFWVGYTRPAISQAERELAVLYAKMIGPVLENCFLDEAVQIAHDRMVSILGSTHEGMLLIDESGTVTVANHAILRLLGIEGSQLQDRVLDELCDGDDIPSLPGDVRARICAGVRAVLDGTTDVADGEINLVTATKRDLQWQVLPVRGAIADRVGALLVVRDVTAERHIERVRQDLAHMIVHDLRSPLTNIMVSVDLLLKRSTGPLNEAQTRILRIASDSSQQMMDLVNALLDIRRLQQRTVDLQYVPVDLQSLAETVIERLEGSAGDKRVRIVPMLETLPLVQADPDMLRRVLQNLVDNAVKFTRPGSEVAVTGQVADGSVLGRGHGPGQWIVVEVRDHGPGIAEEHQQVIFELFGQAPAGYGRGSGVGLAFCKLAVEAHGGTIWIESVLEQGSSFLFTLPIAS